MNNETLHPMQPVSLDKDGVMRFKPNQIINHLFDTGKLDLNQLATMKFSNNDREQIAQLLGYSVSGYGDLSYVSRESLAVADAMCLPENMAKSELQLQNEHLRDELKLFRDTMAQACIETFGTDPREQF